MDPIITFLINIGVIIILLGWDGLGLVPYCFVLFWFLLWSVYWFSLFHYLTMTCFFVDLLSQFTAHIPKFIYVSHEHYEYFSGHWMWLLSSIQLYVSKRFINFMSILKFMFSFYLDLCKSSSDYGSVIVVMEVVTVIIVVIVVILTN